MSHPQAMSPGHCPFCGSADIIRTVPEKDPFHVMFVCTGCQRVITADAGSAAGTATRLRNINDKTVEICLSNGILHGIRFYLTEKNKLPGHQLTLQQAKQEVEALIASRGLTNAIKKPNRNGCVVLVIVLLIAVAIVIYFFTR